MEFLHVSHYLPWFLSVSYYLSKCDGVAVCLSQSSIVAGFLSLTLLSNRVATFLSLSPIVVCCPHCYSGPIELLHVSHFFLWLLAVSNILP